MFRGSDKKKKPIFEPLAKVNVVDPSDVHDNWRRQQVARSERPWKFAHFAQKVCAGMLIRAEQSPSLHTTSNLEKKDAFFLYVCVCLTLSLLPIFFRHEQKQGSNMWWRFWWQEVLVQTNLSFFLSLSSLLSPSLLSCFPPPKMCRIKPRLPPSPSPGPPLPYVACGRGKTNANSS